MYKMLVCLQAHGCSDDDEILGAGWRRCKEPPCVVGHVRWKKELLERILPNSEEMKSDIAGCYDFFLQRQSKLVLLYL